MELAFLQKLSPEMAVIFLFICFVWGFLYLNEKIKIVSEDLTEFQQFQEKKCVEHKTDGQRSFERLENKFESGLKTVFDRLENLQQLLIKVLSERTDR